MHYAIAFCCSSECVTIEGVCICATNTKGNYTGLQREYKLDDVILSLIFNVNYATLFFVFITLF